MAFAAGAFVFPGGRVDPGDERLAEKPDDAPRIAAIRECIEESGIAVGLEPVPSAERAREIQAALLDCKDFAAILERYELGLDLDALTPFARWMPGPEVSQRFDTSFFIAEAPAGDWLPHTPAGGECVSGRWVTAKQMLDEEDRGEAKLMYPTRKSLERLALHRSFAAMRDDAERYPVQPITPVRDADGEGQWLTIPEGLGYPITRDPVDKVRRG